MKWAEIKEGRKPRWKERQSLSLRDDTAGIISIRTTTFAAKPPKSIATPVGIDTGSFIKIKPIFQPQYTLYNIGSRENPTCTFVTIGSLLEQGPYNHNDTLYIMWVIHGIWEKLFCITLYILSIYSHNFWNISFDVPVAIRGLGSRDLLPEMRGLGKAG